MAGLQVRTPAVSEWELFREFRLLALKEAPGVFATSHVDAAQRKPETWKSLVSGPANQVFGLFDGGRLVGITGAFAWPDDRSGETATLVMSPEFYYSPLLSVVSAFTTPTQTRSTTIWTARACWQR
jgi:hypothetical protein